MSLAGAGVRPNGLNPLTCANLLKVIVLPRSLYGCELWSQLSNQLVVQLERMQRFCLKIAQGFGKLTRSDKAIGMIGMPRIQAYITRQKFHPFRRFCLLPAGHTVKKIFSLHLVQHILQPTSVDRGFIPDLLYLARRYNLTDLVWMDLMKGNISDKTAWDELITYHITESEYEEHAARTAHSDDFLIYNKIQDHCFRPSLLWEAAKVIPGSLPKFSFVAKMVVSIDHLTSAHPLLCQLCGFLYSNPIIHALSSCSILLSEHDHLWEFICNYCSLHLQAYLNSLDDEGFTVVLLGGQFQMQYFHPLKYIICYFIDSAFSLIKHPVSLHSL